MGKVGKVGVEQDGLALVTEALKQKLRYHATKVQLLSTQELIKIHETLVKDRPTGEFIFMTLVNQLEFLDTEYTGDASEKQVIETFLYAFKAHVKTELSLFIRTQKDADKIP